MHVTADSFAVKSSYCVAPLREARPNEGEEVSTRKECVTTTFMDEYPHHTHTHTNKRSWQLWEDSKRFLRKETHLEFTFRKYEIFLIGGESAVTLGPLGSHNVV